MKPQVIIIVSGSQEESVAFGKLVRAGGDLRPSYHLDNPSEFDQVVTADVVYTGSYMRRPDIRQVVDKVEIGVSTNRYKAHLIPVVPPEPSFALIPHNKHLTPEKTN